MLLLSVAPLVNTNLFRSRIDDCTATCSRARCTARLALIPYPCVRLPALPISSPNQCATASRTAGSSGVVALQSK